LAAKSRLGQLLVSAGRLSNVKYRYLKEGERVLPGDQCYLPITRGWGKVNLTIGHTVKEVSEFYLGYAGVARRFRRKVK
jgi:hypothetical protein